MPLPIIDAISLGESTTESGPTGRLSFSTLVWVEDRAFGVGAPTDVSDTGGRAVRRGPSQRDAAWRSGSRNHQATSAITQTTARSASRNSPLRQPFTVSHVVHRTTGLERALHQIDCVHDRRLGQGDGGERGLDTGEDGRPRIARPTHHGN